RLRLRGGDQRRCAGALHRGRLDRRQGDARPTDDAARRGASGLRLRAPYGLQRAGAFRRAGAPWPDHPSSALLRAWRRSAWRAYCPTPPRRVAPLARAWLSAGMSTLSVASGPMLHVSLIVEALRARPAMMFWMAALAQTILWTLVPGLFYGAPP